MPYSDRFRRPLRRLAAVTAAGALLSIAALGVPSSAVAYEQHFCQNVLLSSTEVCKAQYRHSLQYVDGHSVAAWERVCVASFTSYWGTQNSDWHCEYGFAQKNMNGRDGVGAIRNGDPQAFVGYGVQGF